MSGGDGDTDVGVISNAGVYDGRQLEHGELVHCRDDSVRHAAFVVTRVLRNAAQKERIANILLIVKAIANQKLLHH